MITAMLVRYYRALFAELSSRPILWLTLGYLATGVVQGAVQAYRAEKDRIDDVIETTIAELDARSEQIEARMSDAVREELDATYTPATWGEVPS